MPYWEFSWCGVQNASPRYLLKRSPYVQMDCFRGCIPISCFHQTTATKCQVPWQSMPSTVTLDSVWRKRNPECVNGVIGTERVIFKWPASPCSPNRSGPSCSVLCYLSFSGFNLASYLTLCDIFIWHLFSILGYCAIYAWILSSINIWHIGLEEVT